MSFIKFDIVEFYPSILEKLLRKAINFAKTHTTISIGLVLLKELMGEQGNCALPLLPKWMLQPKQMQNTYYNLNWISSTEGINGRTYDCLFMSRIIPRLKRKVNTTKLI